MAWETVAVGLPPGGIQVDCVFYVEKQVSVLAVEGRDLAAFRPSEGAGSVEISGTEVTVGSVGSTGCRISSLDKARRNH